MRKKSYEAPAVQKVRLVVRNSVLGNCNSSPDLTPRIGAQSCKMVPTGCYYPPSGGSSSPEFQVPKKAQ